MAKQNRIKKRLVITAFCVLLALISGILFLGHLGIVPCKRKWFSDYHSFCKTTGCRRDYTLPFFRELPSGAEGTRYICYTGGFDQKTGVSFTVSDSDYREIKETLLSAYRGNTTYEGEKRTQRYNDAVYLFDGEVSSDFLKREELGYLKEIFRDPPENYKILVYKGDDAGGQHCVLEGTFCNDETNEIVIFRFADAFRESRG